MNAEERQALREKHQKKYYFPPTCEKCDIEKNDYEENLANGDLIGCGFTESEEHVFGEEWWACAEDGCESWPCDVIKVLDATENLKPNDLKTEPEIRASATSDVLPVNECASHKEAQMAYLNFWNTLQDLASLGYRRNASCAECGEPLRGWSDLPTAPSEVTL